MEKWKGSSGEVRNLESIDLTGMSFNERCKKNKLNLDDMIHYLEYAKDSGYSAARVNIEQEEYWASLIRHLLMDKVVDLLVPLYENSMICGVRFVCQSCGTCGEMKYVHNEFKVGNQDSYEIIQHCHCSISKERENDIIEYLDYIIDRWCKTENIKKVTEDSWKNNNIE